jgi:DNA-binding LytR/AlgR family response regulator
VIAVAIWAGLALEERAENPAATPVVPPPVFDIRDNARVIRVAVEDILAVSSADNYVEFHLSDGRRPMMRATLGAIEARLGPQGFARTHRSWLANTGRIVEIRPTGAGDFTLVLQHGLELPLSRRFRDQFNAQGGFAGGAGAI